MDVSWTLLWSSVVLSLFLFFMECIVRLHWPLYLLGTACFIAAPFLGISLSLPAVFCLVGFQILFWHVHIIERYGKKKLFLSGEKRSLRSSVWMLAWLSLLFTAAVLLVNLSPRRFYDAAFAVEGLVQRTLLRADDRLIDPVSGTVNRGNLYPADVPQLVVTSTKQPTQILYLKGFSGDDYYNGQWQEADDTAILQNINENTLHWGNWSDWLSNLYSSMYFVMNQMMIREEPLQPDILMVMPTTARQNQWYQPYFSIWRRDEGQGGYYYEFFEQKDVDIDWDNVPDQLTTARDWYYAIQNAYMQEAQNEYTQVSETDIPTLAQFVRDHPMEDLDQITGFILQTLEGATYTRTPGFFAMNEDPVEYFLFESGQGYCQHFASAAVLMYRLYGVPARYTAGYAVSPDDFVLREDGTYQAMVTDASAHAWPEIYLEDFGWVPVEVTPAADGTISPSYPGFDPEKVQQPDQAETTRPELEAEMPKEERKEPALSDRQQTRLMDAAPILPFIYLAAVCVLQVGPILWHLRKERKRRWLERGGSLRVFSRMMDMLHFGGWLGEYDGSESEVDINGTLWYKIAQLKIL